MPSPVALYYILGWMIVSGEDITDIRCFLVRLVTEDNWQYDHGNNMLEVIKVRSRTLSSLVAKYLVGGFMRW
jgi:hypothetical protein